MFNNIYKDKKVLITGSTGFKGSWLSVWLVQLGAEVIGFSNGIPTYPSMYEDLNISKLINSYDGDIRNLDEVKNCINNEKPDFIFHLAAQPIVSESYANPIETITTNTIGSMNIMEALRAIDWQCSVVLITSDKSYDNLEWVWGYKESDMLGGKDIYSGSKGAAELIIKSYFHSFLQDSTFVKLAVARAGNVIGGGDWAKDRIIVDCIKAWSSDQSVQIRCPKATRPWQHVLEPLSGYLCLGQALFEKSKFSGEAFNFGPRAEQNRTVIELIEKLSTQVKMTGNNKPYNIVDDIPFKESSLLKLNCDKALFHLKWEALLNYEDTIKYTAAWYSDYILDSSNLLDLTIQQIKDYENEAEKRGYIWTN